jgi:hypothetical protein
MSKRRVVLRSISIAAAVSVVGIPLSALADLKKVDEKEPQAVSLGYKDDTATVDKSKYPKHDPSQVCSGCQFYDQSKASGQLGPCSIFGGRPVAAKGWCSAYVKKAG